jgi:hypothetical protein
MAWRRWPTSQVGFPGRGVLANTGPPDEPDTHRKIRNERSAGSMADEVSMSDPSYSSVWTEEYSVNIKLFDLQHERLVRLICRLEEAMKAGLPPQLRSKTRLLGSLLEEPRASPLICGRLDCNRAARRPILYTFANWTRCMAVGR